MEEIQYINLRNITKLQGNGRKQGIGHDNDKTIQNLEKGEIGETSRTCKSSWQNYSPHEREYNQQKR
jgi:hypothetical protein